MKARSGLIYSLRSSVRITRLASNYWDMRFGMACTVTSAEVVGKLFVRDFNKILVTHPGRRQAPRDPNFSAYGLEDPSTGRDVRSIG